MHVNIHSLHHGNLEHHVYPWQANKCRDINADSAGVEGKDICEWHERTALSQELLFHILRQSLSTIIFLLHLSHQALELRGAFLLALAVVGIVEVECATKNIFLCQSLIDSTLRSIVVELATILAFKEEEVNLTVVVGKTALNGNFEEN